ncbi:MAG: hypothetical protein GY816_09825 [Cytophagales bacterium]|nr:hypothetical protein [Cytophagales bacterium]
MDERKKKEIRTTTTVTTPQTPDNFSQQQSMTGAPSAEESIILATSPVHFRFEENIGQAEGTGAANPRIHFNLFLDNEGKMFIRANFDFAAQSARGASSAEESIFLAAFPVHFQLEQSKFPSKYNEIKKFI